MSYTNDFGEVVVAKDASLATAADIGDWAPGYFPAIIRAAAIVFTTAVNATGQVKLDKRPTAGSDTSRGDGDVATLNYTTTTGAQGKVVYKDKLDVAIAVGEEVVWQVTDATPTAGAGHLVMVVEVRHDTPANEADMAATT